ncbi:Myozenin-2 Calsarcin-1 FATZ-related protein 2 [Triplophysa tibetana]|uniref:Myozenin-2 Calsarcin-1 FATZ-related protein 2 n=1 Tax=Triplophysa tibetana TaxID=1572043 RepID=A0A5A9NLM8_9TELE|nr:Myozenin-2 Calsarcin-1 FATZ-related protein 2 [Triplophysa tibetana]
MCEGLNLGKKISVPRDVMMEELNLTSNRGSRMFQERQRRVEGFTLESTASSPLLIYNDMETNQNQNQMRTDMEGGKENLRYGAAGKHGLAISMKGNPSVMAPGYTGPLREIPREKFNSTVIPKSYCSPWREALGESEELSNLEDQLSQTPKKLPPANYRCFNRAAMPFGGPVCSRRVIPVIGFEQPEIHNLPAVNLANMSKRPNFNRAPRGWGVRYSPESNDL